VAIERQHNERFPAEQSKQPPSSGSHIRKQPIPQRKPGRDQRYLAGERLHGTTSVAGVGYQVVLQMQSLLGNSWVTRALKQRDRATSLQQIQRVQDGAPQLTNDQLAAGASLPDRGGLTLAGRALQKHGNRPGSAFQRAQGNAAAINAAAQAVVDEILNTGIRAARHHARFGEIIEVHAPDGRGLRFDSTGKLIGFLEP
jgi:hypothetical protein